MDEKIYCSQCHLSVFRSSRCTSKDLHIAASHGHVLYCYQHKCYYPCSRTIGGCRYLLPESREKLLAGVWRENVAQDTKPR